MKVLGVDAQLSAVAACLREGVLAPQPIELESGADRPVPGMRLWQQLHEGSDGGLAQRTGEVIDWEQLRRRVAAFLGDAAAVDSIRHTVVAGDPLALQSTGVGEKVHYLCPGRAALLAALEQWRAEARLDGPVAVVVVNDLHIAVHGYRIEAAAGVVARVREAYEPAVLSGSGNAYWAAELLCGLYKRVAEPQITPALERCLWDAAVEMGCRLADAHADSALAWNGPLGESISGGYRLSRRVAERWRCVVGLADALPQLLESIALAAGAPLRQIVLCGVGSQWPFAAQLAARVAPLVPLARPQLAVAYGAACWPDMGEELFRGCVFGRFAEQARPATAAVAQAGHADLDALSTLLQMGGSPGGLA